MSNSSKSKDLIINSLDFFDKNKEKYSKIISKIKYYSMIFNQNDMEHNTIIFYDKNKKELFRSSFEYMGIYYSISNTWVWSWAIPKATKNTTYLAKKIVNYGMDIDYTDNSLLKTELITSRFKIENLIQLDIHIAIASYITKIPFILDIYVLSEYKDTSHSKYYEYNSLDKIIDENRPYERYLLFILDIPNI